MFIILGIIGVFLPVLQGVLFMVIGLMLLSNRYAFAQSLLMKAEAKYPEEYARMIELQDRIVSNKPLMVTGSVVLLGVLSLGIYLAVTVVRTISLSDVIGEVEYYFNAIMGSS